MYWALGLALGGYTKVTQIYSYSQKTEGMTKDNKNYNSKQNKREYDTNETNNVLKDSK